MTITRRFATLIQAFLVDPDVAAEFQLPEFVTPVRLMDDGLEIARPSIVVSVKEHERTLSTKHLLDVHIFELTAMRPKDALQPLPSQVKPDDVSSHMAAFISAMRHGFAPWLADRDEPDRDGFAMVKLVMNGELTPSRDAESRTVDYAIHVIIHTYCLT